MYLLEKSIIGLKDFLRKQQWIHEAQRWMPGFPAEAKGCRVARLLHLAPYSMTKKRFSSVCKAASRSQWPSCLRRVSAADRVRVPPGAWMFVLSVLYNKDKRHSQDNRDKGVQMKYREQQKKKVPPGAWMFFYCECCVCQVEVSATGRSLVQRSPTACGVSLCVIKCYNPYTTNLVR
jgi:hypothetical protein